MLQELAGFALSYAAVLWSWGWLSPSVFSARLWLRTSLSVVAVVPMKPVSSLIAHVESTFSMSPQPCFGAHSGGCLYPRWEQYWSTLFWALSSSSYFPQEWFIFWFICDGCTERRLARWPTCARCKVTVSEHCPALCLCLLTCLPSGEACLSVSHFQSWLLFVFSGLFLHFIS